MQDHDADYHRLFSDPRMVAQLLREFVDETWRADLDLDAMERVNGKFHADTGERRDSDVIWRVPLRSGGDAYLLLLLEFQSTSDAWMALRVLVYAGLLWQHIVKEKRLLADGRLPPVFPLVLYNGDPRWRVPLSLDASIGLPEDSPLWRWQPSVRYHVLDEGAYPDGDLVRRDTLAALLFRLENAETEAQGKEVVGSLIAWFRRHPGFEALKAPFAALASRLLEPPDGDGSGRRIVEDLVKVESMLANRPAQWMRKWKEEGAREAAAGMLLDQLEDRFGTVPETIRQRIVGADASVLRAWARRVLHAGTIDDVLH